MIADAKIDIANGFKLTGLSVLFWQIAEYIQ